MNRMALVEHKNHGIGDPFLMTIAGAKGEEFRVT